MTSPDATAVQPIAPLAIPTANPRAPAIDPFPIGTVHDVDPSDHFLQRATIMIVDDEQLNIDLLEVYLQDVGYQNFCTTCQSTRAVEIMHEHRPDVILLDLMMPEVSGFDILTSMRADASLKHLPAIILTASSDASSKLQALELGANDFLSKPVDPSELVLRLRNTLAAKAYQDQLMLYSEMLEQEVCQRTEELESSRKEVIHCLARAAEYRDDDTGHHVMRVGRYVGAIARQLGMDEDQVKLLEQAAQLHDVGKIGVPDSILLKPGKLDPNEFDYIKQHCDFGQQIIQPMSPDEWQTASRHTELGANIMSIPSSPIMQLAALVAGSHHEKWDGTGYPHGLKGEEIPLEGRITAIADVYDALSSKRPYKDAFPREKCLAIMSELRGTQFDPEVYDAFLAAGDEIVRIQFEYAD